MSMITGARHLPVQHITIRVPWHDQAWNGTICKDPCANTSCMVLPRVGTGKDENFEVTCASQSIEGFAEEALPPCVDEHGTFMASFPVHKLKKHPYQFAETHTHFARTPFRFDSFAAAAIPFRWMLKENVEGSKRHKTVGMAKELNLGYDPVREPKMDDRIPDTWIQEGTNQRVMLDTFFSAVQPQDSLVFFYAKRTPLSDTPRRVIVGVGRVIGVGKPVEYHYEGGKRPTNAIPGYLWERSIAHSIRQELKGKIDGFLLPYHQILALSEGDESLDLEDFTAFAPDEAFEQYSYGSELLHQDNAIASLLSVERALRAISKVIQGPWTDYLAWVDTELNRLWKLRGPYPGFGAALKAFGVERGNLLAWHLAAQQNDDENHSVWDSFEEVLETPAQLPRHLQSCVGPTLARKWQQLNQGRKNLLQLLSRFELSNEQATFWYLQSQRQDGSPYLEDEEIRKNAYLLCEADSEHALQFATVDRGLFAARDMEGKFELPPESRIGESTDPRRVRALMVYCLEHAASNEGHTILPQNWMIDRIRDQPIEPVCAVDADLLPLFDDDLSPAVVLVNDGALRCYQLARYRDTRSCISDEVNQRLEGITNPGEFDWQKLINESILPAKEEREWDELEYAARAEKSAALRMIYQSRISVLMGAAGTGKSTLIKALCRTPGVREGGVLLLAPTGKARVRLEQASDMPGQGKTIAQFLNANQRYDGDVGRYFINPKAPRCAAHRTVVIDECSMLTEDQLAATLDALQGVDRLILVGDPKQLPPIGAGRPYVDICNRLCPENIETLIPRVANGYAELLITRRQQGGDARMDLAFANLFNGSIQHASADETWDFGGDSALKHIEVIQWETPEQLASVMRESLSRELNFDSTNDSIKFEESYGGSKYEGKVYFWPRKKGESKGGAAEKAEAWQVLSPLRHSMVGTDAINRQLQTHYRTFALELSAKSRYRRIPRPMGGQRILWGDKVINVRNKSNRKSWPALAQSYVANGEIGVATGFFRRKDMKHFFEQLEVEMATQPSIAFQYPEWEFNSEQPAPLELAYALTVHKTQGSEFGKTFIVIPRHCRLLTREMLYTALTRHKEKVVLLVQGQLKDLFPFSLDSASETKRRMTNLFVTSHPITVQLANRKVTLDDRLIYRTDHGELVRSKSEWIIADKLHAAGINYVYEPEVMLAGKMRWPDFVISDERRGVTWYWEHLGRMDLPEYCERWEAKRLAYESERIVPIEEFKPGKSAGILITTREDRVSKDLSEQIAAKLELIQQPLFS
ncbi:AAA family ATPase [Noviherbaspirillum sp. 1P10PC]|uniref:AAA family ATPase n=1 Tax=Noviherbaspirillum sp. 1P10PC TaxID=3132292 RepID=UPI0039A37D41